MTATAWTVSELTVRVRDALAARPELEDVLVEGEVSNLKAHASGHLYFTLKDARAAVACVCFRTNALQIPFRPTDGMTLIAHGSVQLYEQQGRYQLYVDRLEPSGVGALALAVEQLQQRLAAEGLFDERRKRPLPVLPRRVVVVTSRSGAALRDVCTVVARRAPCVDVVLSPATVQGEGAVETLVLALRRAERVPRADAILLVRGGGSLEDLMAFNSEALARAIRASRLPVVTGIGHEIDTTVADLAADRRAATPSAAAELIAPSVAQLRDRVRGRRTDLARGLTAAVSRKRDRARIAALRLDRASPSRRLGGMRQDLDRRVARLRHALTLEAQVTRRALVAVTGRLAAQHPARRVEVDRLRLARDVELLSAGITMATLHLRSGLGARAARLEALSPRRTLDRGYSITSDATGRVVTDAAGLRPGDRIATMLRRGSAESTVESVEPAGEAGT